MPYEEIFTKPELENGKNMEIRHLSELDDRMVISRIYEESWKCTYKDIIPQSYLESIPSGKWATHLDNIGMNTLVILENSQIIGTSSYCKSRFSDFADFGEIVSIYLLPEYMGKGYGKKLLEAVKDELVALGYRSIFLWVLEDNIRARAFYEKAGFSLSGNLMSNNIGGKDLRELQYCYQV